MPLLRHVHEIVIIDFAFLIGRLVLNLPVIGCNHLKVYQADVHATQTVYDISHLFACVIMAQKLFFVRSFLFSVAEEGEACCGFIFVTRSFFSRKGFFIQGYFCIIFIALHFLAVYVKFWRLLFSGFLCSCFL